MEASTYHNKQRAYMETFKIRVTAQGGPLLSLLQDSVGTYSW